METDHDQLCAAARAEDAASMDKVTETPGGVLYMESSQPFERAIPLLPLSDESRALLARIEATAAADLAVNPDRVAQSSRDASGWDNTWILGLIVCAVLAAIVAIVCQGVRW
jgi:hypothetical protein